VHGDRDTTAPVEESERMAARLTELGKCVELLVVPGGVHVFNFLQKERARTAWHATMCWLDRWLRREPVLHAGPACAKLAPCSASCSRSRSAPGSAPW